MSSLASGLSSQTVLLENGGRFFVYQPTSGVIASGNSVTIAYQNFTDAQRLFLDNVQQAGLTAAVQDTSGLTGVSVHRSAVGELGLFLAKFGLVLLILWGVGALAVGAIEGATQGIWRALAGIGSPTLSDVITKSDDIVRDFNSVPEDRKEHFRKNVGEISRQLSPIIDAWRNPPDVAAPK